MKSSCTGLALLVFFDPPWRCCLILVFCEEVVFISIKIIIGYSISEFIKIKMEY